MVKTRGEDVQNREIQVQPDWMQALNMKTAIEDRINRVTLVASQYFSMEILKPPQYDDPSQKISLLVLKFLPLMIGYFSLSVPSGLSIYWTLIMLILNLHNLWNSILN